MHKFVRRFRQISMAGLTVAGAPVAAVALSLVASAPAQAATTSVPGHQPVLSHAVLACDTGGDYGIDGGQGWSQCSSGTRQRVVVYCVDNNGDAYDARGPWVSDGSKSWARCHEEAYPALIITEFG